MGVSIIISRAAEAAGFQLRTMGGDYRDGGLPDPTEADEDASTDIESREAWVDEAGMGVRLDRWLTQLAPEFSRNHLQSLIERGAVRVDGQPALVAARKLRIGQQVAVSLIPTAESQAFRPEPMALPIVFEDEHLLVVNKPAGLVVHPAAGNWSGTLMNGLLAHHAGAARLPRAGIVHRLDKDTSGLLVVARSLRAHTALVAQLQARRIERYYLAVVNGLPIAGGSVDAPVGRHPVDRQRMAVTPGGKPAVTHYRIQQRFRGHSLLQVKLDTGRTHQIRVHMAHIRLPLLGDPVYGGRPRLPPGASPHCIEAIQGFRRQALHAERLALSHPLSGEWLEWRAPIPADLAQLLAILTDDAEHTHA
jgi:23S rRNA pseudouridine1911/1915/1917 synthase